MKKYAHNFTEVRALVKQALENGTIYDLDDTEWVTHETELHILDLYINKDREVVARTYNHSKGVISFKVLGKAV